MPISLDSEGHCARCSHPLMPGALACDHCHALVHAEEMERIAGEARSLEAQNRFMEARERWLTILPLLPHESQQAVWIRDHAREMESAARTAPPGAPGTNSTWAKRLAPLAPIAVALAKLKSLASFASFIGMYWAMWGPRFGIGFAVQILIHEMGHYIDIKRRGLPADMPVFFPGLGAYVRWQALGVSVETRAAISLAGPLAGCLAAGVCALLWFRTHNPVWAALARAGAGLNALNLIPIWILDGASAARALRKSELVLVLLVSSAFGYAITPMRFNLVDPHTYSVFYLVAAGCLWPLLKSLAAGARAQQMATLGGQAISLSGSVTASDHAAGPIRHESHGIAAYFIAVLAGLAVILWLVPGRGIGLP